jgi:hypothetical protein
MFCARCGEQIPESSEICRLCGQEASIKLSPSADLAVPASPAIVGCPDSLPLTAIGRDLQGVGGWLLFFCFGLVLLRPAFVVWQIISARDMIAAALEMAPSIVRTVAGLTVGILVWQVRPFALSILRIYFCVIGALGALGIVWFAVSNSRSAGENLLPSMLSLSFTVIWFLYFHRSVRVRATFGRNL